MPFKKDHFVCTLWEKVRSAQLARNALNTWKKQVPRNAPERLHAHVERFDQSTLGETFAFYQTIETIKYT